MIEIGEVIGNKPKVLPNPRKDTNFLATSLQTKDIHGCASGTKGLGSFHDKERRSYKTTNATEDIYGACPGSLKKSPVT